MSQPQLTQAPRLKLRFQEDEDIM